MSTLAERLKLALHESDIRQVDLARICSVTQPSVSGWLSGRSKFLRGANLLMAASALGVRPEWLASGTEPMHYPPFPEDLLVTGDSTIHRVEQLTEEECTLVDQFRALDSDSRRTLASVASALAAKSTPDKPHT